MDRCSHERNCLQLLGRNGPDVERWLAPRPESEWALSPSIGHAPAHALRGPRDGQGSVRGEGPERLVAMSRLVQGTVDSGTVYRLARDDIFRIDLP